MQIRTTFLIAGLTLLLSGCSASFLKTSATTPEQAKTKPAAQSNQRAAAQALQLKKQQQEQQEQAAAKRRGDQRIIAAGKGYPIGREDKCMITDHLLDPSTMKDSNLKCTYAPFNHYSQLEKADWKIVDYFHLKNSKLVSGFFVRKIR